MEESRTELASLEELSAFLAREPLGAAAGIFRDIAFDIFARGGGDLLQVDVPVHGRAGGVVAAGLMAVAGLGTLLEEHPGIFVRVWLPQPLGIDLLVEPLREAEPAETGLLRFFRVHAANAAFGVRRLAGPVTEALIRLREHYHVEMRDEALEFGPLDRPPADLARDLASAIDAMQSLAAPPEADMYQGADAVFCYFCGFTMRPGSRVCAGCGEKLAED